MEYVTKAQLIELIEDAPDSALIYVSTPRSNTYLATNISVGGSPVSVLVEAEKMPQGLR